MSDQSEPQDDEEDATDEYIDDENPELRESRQQERDHTPNEFTTGYDATGDTRVGIGNAGGDISDLVRHNEGRHRSDGDHSAREAARDKKRITEAFCSRLDLPPHQQREAIAAMSMLNLDRFGRQKRLAKVALGTIKVVVERDRYHRLADPENPAGMDDTRLRRMLSSDEDKQYRDLLEEYDVSRDDLYSVEQLVKRELKKREYFGTTTSDTTESSSDPSDEHPTDE